MTIYSIYDAAFKPYGRIVNGCDTQGVLDALKATPCTDSVVYVPRDETLHAAPGAAALVDVIFGGMPGQLGWCNGHNTTMNCMEYHRDSEFNMGTEDFILLLARMEDIDDGVLDSAKVKAFRAPAGVLIEVYATTLHYAPCHVDPAKGFRVLVGLPAGTNTPYRPETPAADIMDRTLWARNKWLLAHPDTNEAKAGAVVAISGVNVDIADSI